MSNVNAPFGFRPVSRLDGSDWKCAEMTVFVASATANVFIGDALLLSGTSNANAVQGSSGYFKKGQLLEVAHRSANDDPIDFVCVGIEADVENEDLTTLYSKTGRDRVIKVVPSRNMIFEAQSLAIKAVGDTGARFATDVSVSGSTTTGVSGNQIGAASANGPLQLLNLSMSPDSSDVASAYSVWNVCVLDGEQVLGVSAV